MGGLGHGHDNGGVMARETLRTRGNQNTGCGHGLGHVSVRHGLAHLDKEELWRGLGHI